MVQQQGVQMFLIPGTKSAMKENLTHSVESNAKMNVDAEGHSCLRDGFLSTIGDGAGADTPTLAAPGPTPLPLCSPGQMMGPMPAMSSQGYGMLGPMSSNGFPSPSQFGDGSSNHGGADDCSESQLKELAWRVKRGENQLKLGLQQLGLMQSVDQDLGHIHGAPLCKCS